MNRKEVSGVFKNCGVAVGDTVFLHGDALVTAGLEGSGINEKMDVLFDGILDLIGPEGTLVLPTFTYSATKGETFDVVETKSVVGLMTEYFRSRPNVYRSSNPIFSVASQGALSDEFTSTSIEDCFGSDTCFGLLHKLDGWIFTVGCSYDRVTFIHYVDQMVKVDYRFFKFFPATIVKGSSTVKCDIRYYVRDLERKTSVKLDDLKERLDTKGLLKVGEIGRAMLIGSKASSFFNTATEMIKEKSNAHIQEGY